MGNMNFKRHPMNSEEHYRKSLIPGIKNRFLYIGGVVLVVIILYFIMSKKNTNPND